MNKVLFIVFVCVIIIGAIVYVLFPRTQTTKSEKTLASVTPTTAVVLPSLDVSTPENWIPFTSKQYGFSMKHPLDIKQQTTQEGERFYKHGPTQSNGTELYDGISLMIKSGNLGGQSLSDFVKKKHAEIKKDPIQPEVSTIESVKIANMDGFSFRVRSIGEGTYIYLPKGKEEYLEIVDGTVEPSNRPQTFKKIVNQILATLKAN